MSLFASRAQAVLVGFLLITGCAESPAAAPAASPRGSILATSIPGAGSIVDGPVEELMLHFSAPVVLSEVTVVGPEGTIPLMITPAGATEHYSIPLPSLQAGQYKVKWRAATNGREHEGTLTFIAR